MYLKWDLAGGGLGRKHLTLFPPIDPGFSRRHRCDGAGR